MGRFMGADTALHADLGHYNLEAGPDIPTLSGFVTRSAMRVVVEQRRHT